MGAAVADRGIVRKSKLANQKRRRQRLAERAVALGESVPTASAVAREVRAALEAARPTA